MLYSSSFLRFLLTLGSTVVTAGWSFASPTFLFRHNFRIVRVRLFLLLLLVIVARSFEITVVIVGLDNVFPDTTWLPFFTSRRGDVGGGIRVRLLGYKLTRFFPKKIYTYIIHRELWNMQVEWRFEKKSKGKRINWFVLNLHEKLGMFCSLIVIITHIS